MPIPVDPDVLAALEARLAVLEDEAVLLRRKVRQLRADLDALR